MIVSPSPDPATRPFRAAYTETSWAHGVDSRTRKHGTFSCLSIIHFVMSVTSRRESYSQQPCCTDHLDTACRCSTQFPSSCKHLQPMYSKDTKQRPIKHTNRTQALSLRSETPISDDQPSPPSSSHFSPFPSSLLFFCAYARNRLPIQ